MSAAFDSSFPTVQWTEEWPIRRSTVGTAVLAVLSVGLVVLGIGWLLMIRTEAFKNPATTVGGIGAALTLFGGALLFAPAAGPFQQRRGIRHHVDATRGGGVTLHPRLIELPVLIMLAGIAAYGISAWWAWRSGTGSDLLPLSKDNAGGARFALILGIGAALAAVLIALVLTRKVTVALYPSGVGRIAPSLFKTAPELVVTWDEIVAITATTCRPSAQSGDLPLIGLDLATAREPVRHRLFDSRDRIGIPAYLLACEPNMLLAIMRFLKEHPEQRDLVARPDAPVWFGPPKLRARD